MEAVHLRATDLTVLTRRFQYLRSLRLLCTLFVHRLKYTARPRQRRRYPERCVSFEAEAVWSILPMRAALSVLSAS
jgi:hypothetical protein